MEQSQITQLSPRSYSHTQRGVPTVEAPLHEAAARAADLLAPADCDSLLVVPELELSGIRPDLWIGSLDEEQFQRRLDAGLEACTAPYPLAIAQVLRRLGGEASVDKLCSPLYRLGERRKVQRGLAELAERGIALRDESAVTLHGVYTPGNTRGVTVEAKTGRWRKAIRQVQMSAPYVNGAWIMFPASYLPHVPRQDYAMRGVGIAVVEDGDVRIVRQPRLRVGRPLRRMLLEEHLYVRWRADAAMREPSAAMASDADTKYRQTRSALASANAATS